MTERGFRRQVQTWDLDDPRATEQHRRMLQSRPFLRMIYDEWYAKLNSSLPPTSARVLELGSGPGYLRETLPELITSDIQQLPWVDRVEDATNLKFDAGSLDAIVMTNVFHHIQDPHAFLSEASRCLRPGGRVVMIEPWTTSWSRLVYRWLHHEPFDPDAVSWELPAGGPLSVANGALPYICFSRDLKTFAHRHPNLEVRTTQPFMPVSYLLSGGFSIPVPLPVSWYRPIRRAERTLLEPRFSMFALIVLERTERMFDASCTTPDHSDG